MIELLRKQIAEQLQYCEDEGLLDLIYKLLLAESN